jgi:hypothetical protein
MLKATDLTTLTQNNLDVETEIFLINVSIQYHYFTGETYAHITRGSDISFYTSTITGSPMTNNTLYYDVWQGKIANQNVAIQMQKVIDYFTQLGYTISRKSDDMEYLYWRVTW